ncbi:MAG: aldehyde dehydrogenase family protein, partial [Flavobacteriales bacterium]|nr:aldehyde dehydrogenase family protein [Flavobacteriales bacterium]
MEVTAEKYPQIKNYVGGEFVSNGNRELEVFSPLDGNVISKIPLSGMKEVDAAVKAGKEAFEAWSSKPIKERVQVLYNYRSLLAKNREELARLVHEENG